MDAEPVCTDDATAFCVGTGWGSALLSIREGTEERSNRRGAGRNRAIDVTRTDTCGRKLMNAVVSNEADGCIAAALAGAGDWAITPLLLLASSVFDPNKL